MRTNFIISFEPAKDSGQRQELYTTMTTVDSFVSLNDFILHMSSSYIKDENFDRVFVKVWKWEDEKAAYMFQSVVYDYDIETIHFS